MSARPSQEDLLAAALALADSMDTDGAPSPAGPPKTGAMTPPSSGLERLTRIVDAHRRWRDRGTQIPLGRWGALVLRERLGAGTSGEVYRAWDPGLHRDVALKLLPAADDATAQRLMDEGRRLARLRHPNVVTVLGADYRDGHVGIWMELLDGRTLADQLRTTGPCDVATALGMARGLGAALEAVHAAGLLHRDVKAQNVLLDGGGRPVLCDFGISVARARERTVPPAGTPLYLAPEVLRGEPHSTSSDLYALGVLLHLMLTGRHPVEASSLEALQAAHSSSGLRIAPALAEPVRRLLEKLLEANPSGRCASAAALVALLDDVAERLDEGPRSARRRPPRWHRVVASACVAIPVAGAITLLTPEAMRRHAGPSLPSGLSRLVADPACTGVPALTGRVACVEFPAHVRARGGSMPPPLVLFDPASGDTRILRTGTAGERYTSAAVSPDGAHAAAVVERDGGQPRIRRVGVTGDADRDVFTAAPDVRGLRLTRWSAADGALEARAWHRNGSTSLMLISPRDGRILRTMPFQGSPQSFSRSPDGRHVAYDVLEAPGSSARDIAVCTIATNQCRRVGSHPGHDAFPLWAPGGGLLFLSDRSGVNALWLAEQATSPTPGSPRLVRDSGRSRPQALGFDAGGTLYLEQWVDPFDVYVADINASAMAPVRLSPRAVDTNRGAVWSPDGNHVAYVSQRGPFAEPGSTRLVVQRVSDRAEREFVFEFSLNATRLSWSPDGRHIAMRTILGPPTPVNVGVYVLSSEDGRILHAVRPGKSGVPTDPGLTADWLSPRQLLVVGRRELHTVEIGATASRVVWSAPSGTVIQQALVAPDRTRLAVSLASAGPPPTVRVVLLDALAAGPPHEVGTLSLEADERPVAWSQDGSGLLVTRGSGAPAGPGSGMRLWRRPWDGTAPTELPLAASQIVDVSAHPDGRRVALTLGAPQLEFWMVGQFGRETRRRTGDLRHAGRR